MATQLNNIEQITANDLCVSCGGCTHICPFQNAEMSYRRGKWEAVVKDRQKCSSCVGFNNCLSVCPTYDNFRFNSTLGNILNVYLGFSNNAGTRFSSSTGGVCREICTHMLNEGKINGVIAISFVSVLDYEPQIYTDATTMPNSIYHSINFEKAARLLATHEGKYLVIGLPCQIKSLRLLAKHKRFASLQDRIYATIALICGYSFPRVNMEAFASYNNLCLEQITYREAGRYRKTRITGEKVEKVFDIKKPANWDEKINNALMADRFLCQTGCLYCVNHLGLDADLVVGDAWLKRCVNDQNGTNLIFSRTEVGEAIIKQCPRLNLEIGTIDDIFESQKEYASGAIAHAMRHNYPPHDLSLPKTSADDTSGVAKYRFKVSDLIKVFFIKPALLAHRFRVARYMYIGCYFLDLLSRLAQKVKRVAFGG